LAITGGVLPWVVIAAASLLAVLVAAELTVRAAAPKVCDLLEWRDWECQHKVAAIEDLAGQGGASVVVIGSSPTNSAFDAHLFTARNGLERPAFNAALNAASIRTLELWTTGVVLPKLRPDLLILGLNSSELSDNNLIGERGFRQFERSIGWRRLWPNASVGGRLLLWMEKRSFLIRYRHFLHEPGGWGMRAPLRVRWMKSIREPKRLFRKSRGEQATVTSLGMLHALSVFRGAPYQLSERVLTTWEKILRDYEAGGHELAALGRLVDSTRAAGVKFLMVLMPVTQDWIEIHPHGQRDFDRFKHVLDDFVAERDVAFVDLMPEPWAREEYADAVHRNDEGREHFTNVLSASITDLLASTAQARGKV
jgi:hypothetical protein